MIDIYLFRISGCVLSRIKSRMMGYYDFLMGILQFLHSLDADQVVEFSNRGKIRPISGN